MIYTYKQGLVKESVSRLSLLAIALIFAFTSAMGMFTPTSAASSTVKVSGSTVDVSLGENGDSGWWLDRDQSTSTDYTFSYDEASIGEGSLYVPPIENTNTPKDKFIAENFVFMDADSFESVSYDFLVAGNGTASDANEFYMNVYANLPGTPASNFYECRFDFVPGTGSEANFETATFTKNDTPSNVAERNAGEGNCPETIAELPDESTIRMYSISVGDTSASDTGLAGYLDNVVMEKTTGTTTYDFEPAPTLNTEEFIAVDGSYKGISVGFNTATFDNASAVEVTLERADGTTITKNANSGVLDLINNNPTGQQLTAPFVIQDGTFSEANDTEFWEPAPQTFWGVSTKPVKVTITVTDNNGDTTAINEPFNEGSPSWPLYVDLLPPDNSAPSSSNFTIDPSFSGNTGTTARITVDIIDQSGVDLNQKYTYVRFKPTSGGEYTYGFSKVENTLNTYEAIINTRDIVPKNQFNTSNVSFRFKDNVGNARSAKPDMFQGIGIDNSGPGSSLATPSDGDSVNGIVRFTFNVTDDTGVSSGYMKLNGTNGSQYNLTQGSGGEWYADVDTNELDEESYTIDARFRDSFGTPRYGANKGSVTVDNTNPGFAIKAPADGSKVSDEVEVIAEITDESGIQKVLMTVPMKDGNKTFVYEDGKSNNSLEKNGDNYSVAVDTNEIEDGVTHITLRGTDKAGNTRYWNNNANNRQHSFTVDNTAPVISDVTADNPVAGSATIEFMLTDEAGIDLSPGKTHVRFYKGTSLIGSAQVQSANASVTDLGSGKYQAVIDTTDFAPSGSEGEYWVYIRAEDTLGNAVGNNSTRGIIVDNRAPQAFDITVPNPSVGSVEVRFKLDETNSVDLTPGKTHVRFYKGIDLRNATVQSTNTPVTYDASADEYVATIDTTTFADEGSGEYWIYIRAEDTLGNAVGNNDVRGIIVDNSAPELGITSVEQTTGTLSFNGYVNDPNLNYYYCWLTPVSGGEVGERGDNCVTTWANGLERNGNPATLTDLGQGDSSNPVFMGSFDVSALDSGDYIVRLSALDLAGNQSFAEYQATVDNTAPTVEVDPSTTTVETGESVVLQAQNESEAVTYSWTSPDSEVSFTVSQTENSATVTSTTAGTFTVDLTVTDGAGNSTAETASVAFTEPEEEELEGVTVPDNRGTQRALAAGARGGALNPVPATFGFAVAQTNVGGAGENQVAENEGEEEEENGEEEGTVAAASTDDNGQTLGLSDQTEEASSSMNWLWILLGLAGLTAMYLLFVRKKAEQE